MREHWKKIKEFHTYYASDQGRIRGPLKIRKAHINRNGYLQLHLSVNGKDAVRTIHTLVATTFLGPPPKGKKINHKNGKKTDNRLENLEYMTPKENTQHAANLFLMPFGERNNKAKLTDEQVQNIRRVRRTAKIIAIWYGVSKSTIDRIRQGRTWRHLLPALS